MKIFLFALIVFFPTRFFAQDCYHAKYKGIYMIPDQDFSFDLDSSARSNIALKDSAWQAKLTEKISNKIVWEMSVQLQDSISYFEPKMIEQPTFVTINYSSEKSKRVGNRFYTWNKDLNAYELSPMNISNYQFTGKSKLILSYTCYEAISKKDNDTQTIWLCKDLPSGICPGIICNLSGAILEWSQKDQHYIITSLERCK